MLLSWQRLAIPRVRGSSSAGSTLFVSIISISSRTPYPEERNENTTMGKSLGIKSYKSPDTQKQSDGDLKNAITNGKGKMPSYKSLTPEQIDGLVKNVRELGK